jgi:uncharacterized protein
VLAEKRGVYTAPNFGLGCGVSMVPGIAGGVPPISQPHPLQWHRRWFGQCGLAECNPQSLTRGLNLDKIYFSYSDIHKTVRTLADKVRASGFNPDVMVAIGTGGFIPARILKTYLKKPILTVGLVLYDDENQPKESPMILQWIDEGESKLTGKRVLLVDEVDDSRVTLGYCLRQLLHHGPAKLGVAVLHNKVKPKNGSIPEEVQLYIAGAELEDKWICYPWDALDITQHEKLARAYRPRRPSRKA